MLVLKARTQQGIYFHLINGMVQLHQKYRLSGQYEISDELRELLKKVGVQITQGTQGIQRYEDIPKSMKGRPIGDTWKLDEGMTWLPTKE
jgi:hypothetical protein